MKSLKIDLHFERSKWMERLSEWPEVNDLIIDDLKCKAIYKKRRLVVEEYFQGIRVNIVCDKHSISPGEIQRLLKRCLVQHGDGRIFGWRGLVPYIHTKPYLRIAKTKKMGGCSGEFRRLLEKHPDIRQTLLDSYLRRFRRYEIGEVRIQYKTLHKHFVELCKKVGLQSGEYPLNTKLLGKRTLHRFLKAEGLKHIRKLTTARHGKDASGLLSTGTGKAGRNTDIFYPYQQVQIDGHRIDGVYTILIQDSYGRPIEICIERPWILVVMEVSSRAILSFVICLNRQYSTSDVLRVFKKAIVPNEGVSGGEGDPIFKEPLLGMPSEVYPELAWAVWNEVAYDNALPHLSELVRMQLTEVVNCSVNAGTVSYPVRRAILERFFRTLEERGFHRLPNTTGSNPQDVRRENPELAAQQYHLSLKEMESLLGRIIRDYNHTPHTALDNRSPLEVLKYYLEHEHLMVRKIPEHLRDDFTLLSFTQKRNVRGDREGGRRPYIEFEGVRYTSDILSRSYDLIGKTLFLQINMEDIRSVKAFLENGTELGILMAHGRWAITKHDLETRKTINNLKHRKDIYFLEHEDPVEVYLEFKKHQALKDKRHAGPYQKVMDIASKSIKPSKTITPRPSPSNSLPPETPFQTKLENLKAIL